MPSLVKKAGGMTVTAHVGDCKTLLAFDFDSEARAKDLAGFSIQCKPGDKPAYYLWNTLRFEDPERHAQEAGEPPHSSVNAPIQKFRWLHVPGSAHQGTDPHLGLYTYTVTPRYMDAQGRMLPLDSTLGVSLQVPVGPFDASGVALGFTRGYTQSQAFTHHFGKDALLRPRDGSLLFDTKQPAGTNATGEKYTFADEYEWLGSTAREHALRFLDAVLADPQQYLSAFCYDLNDPDVCSRILQLASQGRARVILDNAALHTSTAAKPTPEDQFEQAFRKAAREPAAILRGHFGRYAHDKVFIAFTKDKWLRVLTGSTNFSITGFCVNSNHVLVFEDPEVVATYGALFQAAWSGQASLKAYQQTPFPGLVFKPANAALPRMQITFAPHTPAQAKSILDSIADRIRAEDRQAGPRSVLFAVMEIGRGVSAVLAALKNVHADTNVLSLGISDTQDGTALFKPGQKGGILVTGKPGSSVLPPPFDQIRFLSGIGHQIHHKFVICGFNGPDPTVFCGSSNLAEGGESANGDNLLEIHDPDIATAFAVEAIALTDHFHYLNVLGEKDATVRQPRSTQVKAVPASKQHAAEQAGWFLFTDDRWATPCFDPADLRSVERQVFAVAATASQESLPLAA